jgi:hypothetical protein
MFTAYDENRVEAAPYNVDVIDTGGLESRQLVLESGHNPLLVMNGGAFGLCG